MDADDDEQSWIQDARRGDRRAWDLLLAAYELRLFGFARRLVENREDAMDVVQETFIAAVRHIASLRDDKRFAGWLFAIARQRSLQCLRRRNRSFVETAEELPDVPDVAESAEQVVFRADQAGLVEKAIAALPETQKTAILLHYFLDLPLTEIAEVMEAPVGTVKSRLYFAREALRRALSEEPL